MAIGAAIVTAVAGAASAAESRKARKEQARARAIQQKSSKLKAIRQALQTIREAQISRAQIIAAGEAAGVGDSSAVQGGASSVQAQAGGNVNFIQTLFSLQARANERLESAHRALGRAQTFSSIASMSSKFIGSGSGGSSSGAQTASSETGSIAGNYYTGGATFR